MDSLSDAVATTAVLVGFVIAYWAKNQPGRLSGHISILFILYTGISTAKETLNLLLGEAPDPEFVNQIKRKCCAIRRSSACMT